MNRKISRTRGFVLVFGLLILWEIVARIKVIRPDVFFPPIVDIFNTFGRLIISGEIPRHVLFTLMRCFEGYCLAAVIAVPLGILMGRSKAVYRLFEPLVEMLRPIPSAAVIPIAILFLGIYDKMKVAVVVFGSLWPILVNTIDGVRGIDKILIDTGRTFNLKGRYFLTKVTIPGALPSIATGMRISLAIALILSITVEMIVGNNGIGFFILEAERSFRHKAMYAGVLTVAIVGYLINFLFVKLVDDKVLRWYKGLTGRE